MTNPNVAGLAKLVQRKARRDELLSIGYWAACAAVPISGTILEFWEVPRERGPNIQVDPATGDVWWIPVWIYLLVRSYIPVHDMPTFFMSRHPREWFEQHIMTKHYYLCSEYPEKRLIILTERKMFWRTGHVLFTKALQVATEEVQREIKKR